MKSRGLILVAGVVLLAAAGGAAALLLGNRREVTTSSDEAYDAYRQAVTNERRFYLREARLGFARAAELDPEFAMALVGLSRYAEKEQALSLLRRAQRVKDRLNDRERLHVELAAVGREKGHDAARGVAEEIHRRFPDDIRAASVLAGYENASGNTERALKIFQELLEQDPNVAEAYNMIGYYYGYRGDYTRAIESLKKYQFMAPDQANPHDSLGEIQAYSGRYDEAIANLNRALAIKPDFWAAYQHLGVAYEGKGEWSKAIDSYRKASEHAVLPEEKAGYLYRAFFIAVRHGVREQAQALRAEIDRTPKTEEHDLARPVLDAAWDLVEKRPRDAESKLAAVRPRFDEVFVKKVRMAGRKPYWAPWNYLMACAKEEQGKDEEALALYREMANPPNPWGDFDERRWVYEGRSQLARMLAEKGDLDAAEKLIAENHRWNPSWAPAREAELTVARLRREKVLAAGK